MEWPHVVSRPHLAKVTRKRQKTLLSPTKGTQLCLWYSRSGYAWGLNSTRENKFLQEGCQGEKDPATLWLDLHLYIWGTNCNTLSVYIGSFAWKKPLRLGQIPTLGTLSELQNNELHVISSLFFWCILCKCEHGQICLDVIGKRRRIPSKWWVLLQIPLIPDLTALPFVLQHWALHHHLTASTLAYTITTAHSRALQPGACSMPWPGRLICCHLPVVCIFYIKGRQKLTQPGRLWVVQVSNQTPLFCKTGSYTRAISMMASKLSLDVQAASAKRRA